MSTAGVLLMTFGSAVTAADVPSYLASVRSGREVPPEVISEFTRRYERIGRSPLIDITLAQAAALREELVRRHGDAAPRVGAGMLHSAPHIDAALSGLVARGVDSLIAVVLAPQYSPIILAGYERAIERARATHPSVEMRIAAAWHLIPAWVDSLAERVRAALSELPDQARRRTPIIFTAHSLPRAVVDRDPAYIDQLRETAAAVASRLELPAERWTFAYQSAGHTPEEWLTPDVKDLLPALHESGFDDVLVVPVQFLADHLEILYDIDVAAREEAAQHGMRLHRIDLPNTSPQLVRALADVADRELAAMPARTRPENP